MIDSLCKERHISHNNNTFPKITPSVYFPSHQSSRTLLPPNIWGSREGEYCPIFLLFLSFKSLSCLFQVSFMSLSEREGKRGCE